MYKDDILMTKTFYGKTKIFDFHFAKPHWVNLNFWCHFFIKKKNSTWLAAGILGILNEFFARFAADESVLSSSIDLFNVM